MRASRPGRRFIQRRAQLRGRPALTDTGPGTASTRYSGCWRGRPGKEARAEPRSGVRSPRQGQRDERAPCLPASLRKFAGGGCRSLGPAVFPALASFRL